MMCIWRCGFVICVIIVMRYWGCVSLILFGCSLGLMCVVRGCVWIWLVCILRLVVCFLMFGLMLM